MAPTTLISLSLGAALIAIIYQSELYVSIALATGITHNIEPLSAFPYKCRRIDDARLQACEDMWLSESTRQLFFACSDSLSRKQWQPNNGRLNASARGLTDAIYALDLDEGIGSAFPVRRLNTPNFTGLPGDEGRLYPLSMAGEELKDGSTRLWIVNTQPSIADETGTLATNHAQVGANATVEVFLFKGPKTTSLEHIKTFYNPQIATPNRVAPVGDGSLAFHFTNDHGHNKVGFKHEINPLLGWSDVSYCDERDCRTVASGHKLPNGLSRGHDGLLYVPSSLLGRVYVYQPSLNGSLEALETIDIKYSIDNISPDKNGDLYIATFPKGFGILNAFNDPLNSFPAAAATRVRKTKSGYEIVKIIEDGLGEVLPAATTVVHDATTGKLFFSSVVSPFVAVCDKINSK